MARTETGSSTLEPELYMDITEADWLSAAAVELSLLQVSLPIDSAGGQQFLDLGCGTGIVTRDVLLPRCPPFRRIVAVDASRDMVEYAMRHFAHVKICYDVLDIVADDVSGFVERFYASTPLMRFRRKLAGMERWKKYAKICEDCIPPSLDHIGREALISYMLGLLKNAGLTPSICDVKTDRDSFYTNPGRVIQDLQTLNPLRAYLTREELPLLLEDATKEGIRLWADREAGGSLLDFQVFVLRAFKPGPK
ncbi:putative methyltransferase-like protein SPBC21C3.07c [Ixodes scapularis]